MHTHKLCNISQEVFFVTCYVTCNSSCNSDDLNLLMLISKKCSAVLLIQNFNLPNENALRIPTLQQLCLSFLSGIDVTA